MPIPRFPRRFPVWAGFFVLTALAAFGQTAAKPFTFSDVMKFRSLSDPAISADGRWIAYALQPDRGDGEVRVSSVEGTDAYSLERGTRPVFSRNGRWVAAMVKIPAVDAEKPAAEQPKTGMALLDLDKGKVVAFDRVERFAFSDDGRWLATAFFKPEDKSAAGAEPEAAKKKEAPPAVEAGRVIRLQNLETGAWTEITDALEFSFDPSSTVLFYIRSTADGKGNGAVVRELKTPGQTESILYLKEKASFSAPAWAKNSSRAAFAAAVKKDKDDPGRAALVLWDGASDRITVVEPDSAALTGWEIPLKSSLEWSADGKRLFLGLRPSTGLADPVAAAADKPAAEAAPVDLFDFAAILKKREVDVWHVNDPLINPQQKKEWAKNRERTYTAVYDPERKRLVPLASPEMAEVRIPDNPKVALGRDSRPYLKEITWDGEYADYYLVDLASGARRRILSRFGDEPVLSPGGKYAAYFENGHWFLLDVRTGAARNLTAGLDVPFFDDEDDRPAAPRAVGLPAWLEDDTAVLLSDTRDLWLIPTEAEGVSPLNLTAGEGRKQNRSFAVVPTDPDRKSFRRGERLILSSYHHRDKNGGFYAATIGTSGVARLLEEKKKFVFKAAAKNAGTILFTREDYREFPDLWTADPAFSAPRKLSNANPQIGEFAWGEAELVEWASADGRPLQGVLIKPGNYEPGRRCPVLVYYYELSSQRLYEFNQIVVNHRPCFPVYASHGYGVFLPDIRFEIGRPGLSAVKCLVPGVQKLIDLGIADPKAIGLHGHSWSGYETAYVVTQTDIFAAACAGAPVGNMTSAYNGIRWESGLARQFQYEKDQSRIGSSLWERRDLYLENSPVFYADRIKTPLLLMHGDEDGAVPWQQSIELYLSLRRLGKDGIFLQYRGEPHHPRKYANKLDYSIKLMEFFDHYLKGAPAAEWIAKGVPYDGK